MTTRNILFAHNVAKIGGAEKVTLDIIGGLQPEQFKSYLMAPELGPLQEAASELGCQAEAINLLETRFSNPITAWLDQLKLKQWLRKNTISLIHTGDIFIAQKLIPAANALNIPMICHMHFPPDQAAINWVFKKAKQPITFIYCSHELKSAAAPKIDLVLGKHAKHCVVHNGVDVEKFKKIERPNQLLPADKLNIGIVANLQERKGHNEFLAAAHELVKKHDNLAFHIIGGDLFGEHRADKLQQLSRDLGIADVVTFHGQQKNIPDYLNELDIYVCASHEEAFPISMLEAMAFGLPIASTNVNGIPEALTDGENALLFNAKDVEGQVKAIKQLITDAQFRVKLGSKARRDVVARFSDTQYMKSVIEIYAESQPYTEG